MHERPDLQQSFGGIPDLYDAARLGYPPEVVATILASSNLPVLPRVLEIGCGSGQATVLFAELGFPILACDISPALLDLARKRLSGYVGVEFAEGKFEALDIRDGTFDVVISAQAFHWVDQAVGLPKVARVLAPGGVVGLFWNYLRLDADPVLRDVRDIVLDAVPSFAEWGEASEERFEERTHWERRLQATARLDAAQRVVITTELASSPERLMRLLSTYSWFQTQGQEVQERLLADLEARLAGLEDLQIPVRTVVFTARRVAT